MTKKFKKRTYPLQTRTAKQSDYRLFQNPRRTHIERYTHTLPFLEQMLYILDILTLQPRRIRQRTSTQ
jgi:hypothetical protein